MKSYFALSLFSYYLVGKYPGLEGYGTITFAREGFRPIII